MRSLCQKQCHPHKGSAHYDDTLKNEGVTKLETVFFYITYFQNVMYALPIIKDKTATTRRQSSNDNNPVQTPNQEILARPPARKNAAHITLPRLALAEY